MPSRTIAVSGGAFSTSAGAQQCFDKGDRALLDLSTSGESVNSLRREVHDLRGEIDCWTQRQRDTDRTILQWEIASKAVEAFGHLLLEEPSAVSRTSKAQLDRYFIHDVTTLRSLSQQYNVYHNQRSDRTLAASTIYNSIPIYYRRILDHLVRAKAAIYSDRAIITHPPVKKSEISAFLAPYFPQQTNPATELLRAVQDVEVIDSVSGDLVPMFVEG